jgi:radical SAM superfamily enzyme YgiQ (UPF0313 family)
VIHRLHDLGIMVNASFVFGMDNDDETVFEKTVDWAVQQGIETATFHILTPYPGTTLHTRMVAEKRIISENWDLYDTRHAVFKPRKMTVEALEGGYWSAYREFYRWNNIFKSAFTKTGILAPLRHIAYVGGWKKCEPLWDWVIKAKRVGVFLPVLEQVLKGSSHEFDHQVYPLESKIPSRDA